MRHTLAHLGHLCLFSLSLFSQRPVMRRRAVRLIAALVCMSSLLTNATAQDKQYTDNKPDQSLRSDARVDPSTLGMSLGVSLSGSPGRAGASLPVSLRYSSKQWRIEYGMSWQSYINYNTWTRPRFSEDSIAGWTSSLEPPRIEYTGRNQLYNAMGAPASDDIDNTEDYVCYVRRVNLHLPDGSSHELRKDDTPVCYYRSDPNFQYDFTGTFYAVDGSRSRFDADAGVLYLSDGGRYIFGAEQSVFRYQNRYVEGRWGTTYIDRNGNTLTYNMSTKTWTDTLGRTFVNPLPDNPTVGDQTYSVPHVNGTTVNYTLRWRSLADALSVAGDPLRYTSNRRCVQPNVYETRSPYLFSSSYPVHVCADLNLFNPVVLAEVVLPTGQSYQYKYNVWGEIDKVIEPGGGYERFLYASVPTLGDINYPYNQANRGVVERWTSPSGTGSEEASQHWLYSLTMSGAVGTSTTTAPDGTRGESLLYASPHSSSYGFENPLAGMPYEERTYNAANQMLRRKLTQWATVTPPGNTQPRNPHVTKAVNLILDTGGNALVSTKTMAHDGDLNVTSSSSYDFASVALSTAQSGTINQMPVGTLVRTDETTYLVNDATIATATRDAYRARNLLELPSSMRVKNAAGTIVSQSEIKYDEAVYPLLTYGAVTGWTDPATTVRGNTTTTRTWLDTTNSWIEMHTQYDQCGNVRKSWDGRGNLSAVEYSPAYHYAYPTHAISAVPDPSNTRATNTSLESWTAFDFSTGRMTSSTDANNKITTYNFDDLLNRPTYVSHPDGGWTSYWYGRNAYGDYVGTRTAINGTQNTEGYQFFDGLGRNVRSFQLEGTQWITTDTQYDAMGRVWRVSNPYLSGGSGTPINPSNNWTTTTYDPLDRVSSVTTPDGAQMATAYSGNQVTVTDQAGKLSRSVTDGMGRLSQVVEDPNGLAYQTSYNYDVLGNLRVVTQGAQQRYFMYDSLSRLIRVRHPEQGINPNLNTGADPVSGNNQWTLGYTYDANGNVKTKTDARHTTATYEYDNINRLKQTTYSDGTPYTLRTYDFATNGRGRYYADYESSTTGTINFVTNYDAMGRPTAGKTEFYLAGTGWRPAYTTSRIYDKMGHITQQTYPSGHVVDYSQFDVAGRLKQLTGNLGDGVTRTYSTNITYDEAGRLSREKFGTQTPLYHKQRHNSRGQLYDVRLSSVNDADNMNRGLLQSHFSHHNGVWASQGQDNNGNVLRSHHYIPNDEQESSYSLFYQDYEYDGLNRLKKVTETNNIAWAAQYAQAYDYDRWGNRQINAAQTWGAGINNKQFTVDAATNRLGVPGGQVGAMGYDPAGNLTTDSYTGAGARTYDAENRMTGATIGINNSSSAYTYDANGKRMRRSTPNGTVWQVYGLDGELLAEYAANAAPSSPQKEYGYRNGKLLITAAGGSGGGTATAATFVKNDSTTQGTWKGAYGTDGYNLAGEGVSYPAYAQVSVTGHLSHTWAATTTDVRAVQKSASGSTDRIASTWYTPTNYIIDINLTDGQEHQVALYGLDWDANNVRAMRVEALDAATNALLDSRDVSAYSNGQYLVWNLRGHVKLKVIYTGPAGLNATISGLFFDPARVNVAAASQGATATASSVYPQGVYTAASTINGDRRGLNWGAGGGWNDATPDAYPDWVQVDFSGSKTINEVNVFTCQDDYANPSVPTEAMTFSMWGLTAFEVQYWTGAAWATVPGGSVTGNNKVWRKFSFPAVTTTKIRVLTSAALASYSRVTEVEAYQSAQTAMPNDGVQWLVSDHLGTPRIVADLSGSLAGVKRHDYLPFGEEIGAGVGGRTPAHGYVSDNVRQKFTGYERDVETGMDYAQARYFTNVQGRFTGIDPLLPSASPINPQTWNRYAYVANNPLRFTDPSGMRSCFDASCSGSEDEEFGRSQAEDEHDERMRHQYNAMEATNAAREGNGDRYRELMANDNTLSVQGGRILIIVGDPGLGGHNQGANFDRAAETKKQELEAAGNTVIVVRASGVNDFSRALKENGTLNGVEYLGHASFDQLLIGEQAGADTNLSRANLSQLSNTNLSANAYIKLNACYAGGGGTQSIASAIAHHLQRPTMAFDGGTVFSGNERKRVTEGKPPKDRPPSKGPLYLIEDRGTNFVTYYP